MDVDLGGQYLPAQQAALADTGEDSTEEIEAQYNTTITERLCAKSMET